MAPEPFDTMPDLRSLPRAEQVNRLEGIAKAVRREIVKMIDAARAGHIGGDLSVTDILTTLVFGVIETDPANPDDPNRDRLILSKGHCAAALYATLALRGYLPVEELKTYMKPLSRLNGHPNRNKLKGVEANTGPLGHGLPIAVGSAIASKLSGGNWQTFVVTGDGELQEGSNWEAAMAAAHRKLDNLTLVVDRNRLQQGARTEETSGLDPLDDKWAAFGWEVIVLDGNDIGALLDAFLMPRNGRPRAIIANTIKGKGVSFIEDRVEWHHKVPNAEQVAKALEELAG
jgi:transketolase